jgi:hypothetical protein
LAPPPRVEWTERALAKTSRWRSLVVAVVGLPRMGVRTGCGNVNGDGVVPVMLVVVLLLRLLPNEKGDESKTGDGGGFEGACV